MSRPIIAVALLAALAACDNENPFQPEDEVVDAAPPVIDPDNPVSANGIPEALTGGNLNAIAYDPDAGTLSVDMAALDINDDGDALEPYGVNAALQTAEMAANNYQVFSYQDDALDRMFVAIVAESADGSVQGAVVMDGGQFIRFFGGGFYGTDGTYSPGVGENDSGLVSYAGLYAGLSNLDADGAQLIGVPPVPEDDDGNLSPSQPGQVQGSVFINADFGDNTVNGVIYDRSWVNLNPGLAAAVPDLLDLEDVFLLPADITDEGTFFGDTSAIIDGDEVQIGAYGGAFGGTEAPGVAGVVHLDGDYEPDIDNEEEFGVFVLTQCGQPGEAAICDDIPVSP